MIWQKKGLVYQPDKSISWSNKYAMMPTPVYLEEQNVIRIFFGTTDEQNFGRTSFIDVNPNNPSEVLSFPKMISLDLGQDGMFDDCGAVPSSIISMDDCQYMYYVGFQRCTKVPYMLFSGLAKSTNFETFERYSEAPIIDRNKINPISNAAPFVIREGKVFKMWCWIGKQWLTINNKLYIQAEIGLATSTDALKWNIVSTSCINLDYQKEFSVGRPFVIKEDNLYKMWYSVRYIDKLYRLGYAESQDGISWVRKDDEVGIDVSEDGWDSEMICYPAVLKIKEKTYLFYNGNNNGETGFGYAELVRK